MDIRAQQAREHHQMAATSEAEAGRHRALRDRLIRDLRNEDRKHWTHKRLADHIGCSEELIAHIVRTTPPELPFTHGRS